MTREHHVYTRHIDLQQRSSLSVLANKIQPGARVLDLGCGPGRDLKAFTALGHHATGVDGCPRFVEMARAYSGCTVWQQDFVDLDLPAAHFDGVFANAVLFHVP
ncbi:MAG: class I SAM-dependent methyltransferase, partial [Comamonas sp.]